ncbi:hypothetical protein Tph_c22930 [Thermacetogenium phaeum DSM 12270]|uniref:Uncharacterized protein n=1 Tax=Thermacetogenium phaeum (strain ATCC BAA-254 / DSM 26808 / PB) TaxID=1089553 RepID=K4LHW7_THEPS|nr:hypothetical protein Tph_c22930 [Thermacetogenium phaeum DSM 12270]MDK2880917.1 hypothetical protein [Clostridia bacterium]
MNVGFLSHDELHADLMRWLETLDKSPSADQMTELLLGLYKKITLYKKALMPMNCVGLLNEADKRVSDFSKGMKLRLNFATKCTTPPNCATV